MKMLSKCQKGLVLQVALLRGGWNELLIAGFAHRSVGIQNGETPLSDCMIQNISHVPGILLANGVVVTRENAHTSGVGGIFDRVLIELVSKMQEMTMDKTELGCLRAIVLFNPDVKGLKEISRYVHTAPLLCTDVLLYSSSFFSYLFSSNFLILLALFANFFSFTDIRLYHVFPTRVEQLRERVYASLEEYTR